MNILIATSNKIKKKEIIEILKLDMMESNFKFQELQLLSISEPEEPYSTFLENACFKAKYYGEKLNAPTLAEDTGLCIKALKEFPGVKTKDFISQNNGIDNSIKVLAQKMHSLIDYSATFICAAAIYIPSLDCMLSYEGKENGTLTFPARGKQGFGLDPIFIPFGQQQTIAELGKDYKNTYSHRALAIKGIMKELIKITSY